MRKNERPEGRNEQPRKMDVPAGQIAATAKLHCRHFVVSGHNASGVNIT